MAVYVSTYKCPWRLCKCHSGSVYRSYLFVHEACITTYEGHLPVHEALITPIHEGYLPVQESLAQIEIFRQVVAKGTQAPGVIHFTPAEQAGHACHTVDAQAVSIQVDLGMLRAKVHLQVEAGPGRRLEAVWSLVKGEVCTLLLIVSDDSSYLCTARYI